MKQRILVGLLVTALCTLPLGLLRAQGQADPARRLADRQRALEREAADLERQEKTLLTDLRKLEIERQLKTDELTGIERDLKTTRDQLATATARAKELRALADAAQPDIEDRLVRLYKMGRVGYWRLLLDVDDVRQMGRAYRTASALNRLDRERIQKHRATLKALEQPASNYKSVLDVFENALQHEMKVTSLIHTLYELAKQENDYATQVALQWFINEQVEEEATASKVVVRLKIAGNDGAALLMLDNELGSRPAEEDDD